MNIVEFFFGIFKECFNLLNVDFFRLGFTWLEFLLAASVILIIIKFILGVVGVSDSIDTSALVGHLSWQKRMSNAKREKELTYTIIDHDLDTKHGRVTQRTIHKKNGEITGIINDRTRY